MFKNIIILIILATIIYALTYSYKQSKLELTPNMVILKVGTENFNLPYSEIKKVTQNFSNVKIKQYSLKNGDDTLFFELAIVEGLYEFNYNSKEIIIKLFDVKEYKSIFTKNGLEALQLSLSNNQKINMFMVQNDNKELRLFYGLSDKVFSQSIQKLVGKQVVPIKASVLIKPLSLWSAKVNDIDGLISSIDY